MEIEKFAKELNSLIDENKKLKQVNDYLKLYIKLALVRNSGRIDCELRKNIEDGYLKNSSFSVIEGIDECYIILK